MKPVLAQKHINVVLAEDHTVVREGLRALLEAGGDIEVIGEAANGRLAVELVKKLVPDVIVMDIAMPLLNGMEATRQIRLALPDAKVLILSAHNDDAYVKKVVALGAKGYLVKHTSGHVLCMAVREAHKGNSFFSPDIVRHLKAASSPDKTGRAGGPAGNNATGLSSREVEVLQLIAEGQANKQVADELGISIKTVEKHRQRLMEKLDIHDTAGLTRYAISAGIVENPVQLTIL